MTLGRMNLGQLMVRLSECPSSALRAKTARYQRFVSMARKKSLWASAAALSGNKNVIVAIGIARKLSLMRLQFIFVEFEQIKKIVCCCDGNFIYSDLAKFCNLFGYVSYKCGLVGFATKRHRCNPALLFQEHEEKQIYQDHIKQNHVYHYAARSALHPFAAFHLPVAV